MIPPRADGTREKARHAASPSGEKMPIYDAAMRYVEEGTPTVIFGGEEYGTGRRATGSQGTQQLGVKAVVARSFERIHRSNLVGIGVRRCSSRPPELGDARLRGDERFDIAVPATLEPQQEIGDRPPQRRKHETVRLLSRIDTPIEVDYFRHGGILPFVLRELLAA